MIKTDIILNAGDMSQATLTSDAVDLQHYLVASLQAVYTGSPVGNFILQISSDLVPTTWSDYTGSDLAISAAGNNTWNMKYAGYNYIRVKYTKTSGTGSLTITVSAKGGF